MKIQSKNIFNDNSIIQLKNKDWLLKQRVAGQIVAKTLKFLETEVLKQTSYSMIMLNQLAEDIIYSHDCTPTFKNYKGFPTGCCISINQKLVHGIPTDYVLQDGDVVSFDLGATYKCAIADSALTVIFGKPKSPEYTRIINATEDALMKGIAAIKVGNRLGCIGAAISKAAKGHEVGLITNYGGHGISWDEPHASPFVANKSEINEGIRIVPGLTIAIEPQCTSGSTKTWVDKDGWTVWCDADISAHSEHTVYIHEDYVEIITDRSNL